MPSRTIWYLTLVAAPDPYANAQACQLPGGGSVCGTSIQLFGRRRRDVVLLARAGLRQLADGGRGRSGGTERSTSRATGTTVIRGDQTLEIMTEVLSTTPIATGIAGFNSVAVSDVDVHVLDGGLPGLVVDVPAEGLNVVAESPTADNQYTVVLTKAPASNETVTVTLAADDSRLVMPAPLRFAAAFRSVPGRYAHRCRQRARGRRAALDQFTMSVQSSLTAGGVYSAGVVDNPVVHVNVYSGDVGGVLILQPTGSTVVGPTDPATYDENSADDRTDGPGDDHAPGRRQDAPVLGRSAVLSDRWRGRCTSHGVRLDQLEPAGRHHREGQPERSGGRRRSAGPGVPGSAARVLSGIYGPLVIEGDEVTTRTLTRGSGCQARSTCHCRCRPRRPTAPTPSTRSTCSTTATPPPGTRAIWARSHRASTHRC